jgi:hypothetical protein
MIPLTGMALKKSTKEPFTSFFRALVYDSELSYGARCFALACLDRPSTAKIKYAIIARRLHVSASQISIWKKELTKRKYEFGIPTYFDPKTKQDQVNLN